jgi:hypothetical protein
MLLPAALRLAISVVLFAALGACTVVSQSQEEHRTKPSLERGETSAALIAEIGGALKFFDRLTMLVDRVAGGAAVPVESTQGATEVLAKLFAETGLGTRVPATGPGPFRYRFESRLGSTLLGANGALYLEVHGLEAEDGTTEYRSIVVIVEEAVAGGGRKGEWFVLFDRSAEDGGLAFAMNFDAVERLTARLR